MLDLVRTSLHRLLTTTTGDASAVVRWPKDVLRRVNATFGEPLCSADTLQTRRAAAARLAALRRARSDGAADADAPEAPTTGNGAPLDATNAAPVMIYHEGDRHARELGRIREALDARGITYTPLDVAGDEVTKDFVMREARCKEDELPIVFIAGTPVGGYRELVEWDVAGKLTKAVRGA